ncbi:MAG: 50S ribosomal protein L23 [Candidatus Brocadiae bacterium]|nr:50S ribosomal protein L23 [Candidatus Brocadiia bacterium]
MARDAYSIILRPIMTEKSNIDVELQNAYHFEVALDANKVEIKKALEKIYAHKGIKVARVNIMNKHPKKRRFRFRQGYTKAWKKAIVFLDKDYKLEMF